MFGKNLFRLINSDSSVSQGALGMLWVLLFMYLKNVLSWATKHCHCVLWQFNKVFSVCFDNKILLDVTTPF